MADELATSLQTRRSRPTRVGVVAEQLRAWAPGADRPGAFSCFGLRLEISQPIPLSSLVVCYLNCRARTVSLLAPTSPSDHIKNWQSMLPSQLELLLVSLGIVKRAKSNDLATTRE